MRSIWMTALLVACGGEGPVDDGSCGMCASMELCPVEEPAEGDLCADTVTNEVLVSCFYCDGDPSRTRTWGCGLETDLAWELQPETACEL
jgi:hypothetical protein